RALALSLDGRWLASGGEDHEIHLYELARGRTWVLRGHQAEVRRVVFSPDGAWLASAGWDETVGLWRLRDRAAAVLRGHVGLVHAVDFSPDGSVLASGGEDGSVGQWRVAQVALVPEERTALSAWMRAATTATVA